MRVSIANGIFDGGIQLLKGYNLNTSRDVGIISIIFVKVYLSGHFR